jgi:hypothetical protein
MRNEQRERLVALAARAAGESDPVRFRALILELDQLLKGNSQTLEIVEKPGRSRSAENEKL